MKKYIRCISTLALSLLLPWNIILCCGPTLSNDEERFLLFNSAIDGNYGIKEFTYSNELFDVSEAEKQPDFKRNCKEWKKYTSDKASEKDIFEIQYKTPPTLFLNAYKLNNWQNFKGNTFIQWLVLKENHAALDYLALAKQAEAVDILNADPWDTTVERKKQDVLALANLHNKRIATAPVYLQQRYAFQAIKLWFYVGTDDTPTMQKLQQVFVNYLEGRKTIVAAWANIYFAMVQKDPTKKTLYLLKAFDESDEKKQFAFLRIDNKDLSTLAAVTKNTYANSLVQTMFAMKTNGRALENIKKVAKFNPDSKFLPALVGREINKLESWLSTPKMLGFYDYYLEERGPYETKTQRQLLEKKDAEYLSQFVEFLTNLNKAHPRPPLQLALVHIYNMQQNYAAASRLLSMLPVYSNKQYQTQKLIEQVIVTAHIEDIDKQAVKEKLATNMNQLLQLNPPFKKRLNKKIYDRWQDEDAERSDDVSELLLILSRAYKIRGDLVTSGLLYTKANIITNAYDGWSENNEVGYSHIAWYDRFAKPATIDGLLVLKHKIKKTAFEKLLSPSQWAKDDMYNDLKGTILFRDQQYDQALEVFKSMDRNFWRDNYEYSHYLPITPITYTGLVPNTTNKKMGYPIASKLLITQDVVTIIKNITNSTDTEIRAAAYFNLGNAQFNTSYHGKAWIMFSYGKSSNEPISYNEFPNFLWGFYNFSPNDLKYRDNYYLCKSASDNYAKGFALSANKELKAKCLLGLLTCRRFSNFIRKEKSSSMKRNSTPLYLEQLKNYQNTYSFKQAAVHCPDIKEYLGKLK
ncbi:MAG: hypothetical protein LH478_07085 [Chitinophagaceae bacterium]|nr:hypothetical protein [Chitinophagaceae bacterium]